MPDIDERLAQLVAYLQPDISAPMSARMKVMEPFLARGLATADQVASLSTVDYKRAGETLNDLTEPSFDRPQGLRVADVILEGKRGRPQKLYLLTEDGAAALRALFGVSRLNAPAAQDPVELNAAFAIMEVYTAAVKAGLTAAVEKVLPFGEERANIRADVFVLPPNLPGVLFEIEQEVNQGTLPRLLDKLRRMDDFFRKSRESISQEVRVLFNLPQGDRNTVSTWQEALRLVTQEEDLSFQLYWMPILRFLESPLWTSIRGFHRLEPLAPQNPAYVEVAQTPEVLDAEQMTALLSVMQARQIQQMGRFKWLYGGNHPQRLTVFFSLLMTIYDASYHRQHHNRFYSPPPVESLELLRAYLNEPQNRNLLVELRLAIDWLNRRVSWANYLLAANRVLWDVFMRFHGFGDTGLTFRIELPGFSQGPHDVKVHVSLGPQMTQWILHNISNQYHPEPALEWVLEALLKYPYDLGLAEFPWRKPLKGRALVKSTRCKGVTHSMLQKTILLNAHHELEFHFPYEIPQLIAAVKQLNGRRYLRYKRCWIAPPTEENVLAARILGQQFGLQVVISYVGEWRPSAFGFPLFDAYQMARFGASQATEPPEQLWIPGLSGRLYPFQEAGVWYAARTQRCLIADEMGLGKTAQALATLQYVGAFPAIIVCPASLKLHWQAEIQRWLPRRSVRVLGNQEKLGKADLTVLNYEILKNKVGSLTTLRPQAVVFDEGHFLKNPKAQRTQAARKLVKAVFYRLILTGTPIMNRPEELISLLQILGRLDDFGGFDSFAYRYCGANPLWGNSRMDGAAHLTELHNKLRIYCYLRRTKVQVLPALPEKQRTVIPLVVNQWQVYQSAANELQTWLSEKGNENRQDAVALVRLEKLKQAAVQGKWKGITEWLESFLESGEKLVVFAHHQRVIQALVRTFRAPAITGNTPLAERQALVTQFQEDTAFQMLILSLKVGGVGWTLHAASHVVFIELGWTPAEHAQAEDRLHRIGQQRTVHAWYLLAEGTVEEKIYQIIERKRKVVNEVTDGQVVREVLHQIRTSERR